MKYKLLELTARYMRSRMLKIKAPEGAMDVCGTGGTGKNTYNISTAVAFVVAACGVPVAKHGNIASSSKCGSSDVLRELGVNIHAPKEVVEKCINEIGICYMHAPNFHPHFKLVGRLRRLFGKRTVFNLLGVLLNPAEVKYQLVGVYNEKPTSAIRDILCSFGVTNSIAYSCQGYDEVIPDHFTADILKKIEGGNAIENAEALLGVLYGDYTPYAECVILNASYALVVAGKAGDIEEGRAMAIEAIYTGKALDKLEQLISYTNEVEL